MPRSLYSQSLLLALALLISAPTSADGVAVFASLTNPEIAESMRTTLRTSVGVEVEASIIIISGIRWTRVHSNTLPEREARALVAKARNDGYTAWYNGSGDSLASSSSATAVRYVEDPNVVPAQGGDARLPMAETFPLSDR